MAKMTVYDIVKGINQAAANAYDGSHDKRFTADGKEKKAGLKRDDGCAIVDSRVMDGFKVKVGGNMLTINYQSEVSLTELHENEFETEIERRFRDIVKYLKKEYESLTKNKLGLTSQGDAAIHVQSMSRVRSWVEASKTYKIAGMKDAEVEHGSSEDRLDDSIKKLLAIGKDKYPGTKKPENVKAKK